MKLSSTVAVCVALFGAASAFVLPPPAVRTVARPAVPLPRLAASGVEVNEEAAALEKLASQCLDEGCSVDMVENLKDRLRDEKTMLIRHLAAVDDLLNKFEKATSAGSQADESVVEQLVKAIFQIFRVQTPEERYKESKDYFMRGFSGDIPPKNKKDAWDWDLALRGVPPGTYKADNK
jgi:hypothetical protein